MVMEKFKLPLFQVIKTNSIASSNLGNLIATGFKTLFFFTDFDIFWK